MPESTLASHTASHQFVKSGNVFGSDVGERGITAEIRGVQYEGIRFGSGGADADGVLRIATEHGQLQVQTGQGERGFPGDYRFVLQIQGDVNEFLSDEQLDLIERFQYTVEYSQGHVAEVQFAVNLIDVVYSGEHFLSDAADAAESLPAGLLEPAAPIMAALMESQAQSETAPAPESTDVQLSSRDLLPETDDGAQGLDRYFGVETSPLAAHEVSDAHVRDYGAGLETSRIDILPDGDASPTEG